MKLKCHCFCNLHEPVTLGRKTTGQCLAGTFSFQDGSCYLLSPLLVLRGKVYEQGSLQGFLCSRQKNNNSVISYSHWVPSRAANQRYCYGRSLKQLWVPLFKKQFNLSTVIRLKINITWILNLKLFWAICNSKRIKVGL